MIIRGKRRGLRLEGVGIILCLLVSLPATLGAVNVRLYKEKIVLSQEKEFIGYPYDFVVLEDESYLINDVKTDRIMLFDRQGRLVHFWKSVGQGPGEYLGALLCDYDPPYLGIFDARVNKIILYRREGPQEFKWLKDIFLQEGGSIREYKLYREKIIVDRPVFYQNQYYFFQICDFEGKNCEHCLPAGVRYGLPPGRDYRKKDGDFRIIWGRPRSFLDVFDGYIYSAWKGRLEVIKIDLKTKKWTVFGHKTRNYRKPKIWKISTLNLKRASRLRKENEHKFSWVAGVLADRGLVGLLYLSYNRKKSAWEAFLQFYDETGKFLREELLEGAKDFYITLKHYYSRETGCLYVLNMNELATGDVEYEILKYPIR